MLTPTTDSSLSIPNSSKKESISSKEFITMLPTYSWPMSLDLVPYVAIELILELLSIPSNLQILQESSILEWGWEYPEVGKYLIPTTIDKDQEQNEEELCPSLFAAKLLNACLLLADHESDIPKVWVVKNLCIFLGFSSKCFQWTTDLIDRASNFLVTMGIAYQSLSDSKNAEFVQRVYETYYILRNVQPIVYNGLEASISPSATDKEDPKMRVLLRLSHLGSRAAANCSVDFSKLVKNDTAALMTPLSSEFLEKIKMASDILLNETTPEDITSSSRWFRQSASTSEVDKLLKYGPVKYKAKFDIELDSILVANYIKRLLSQIEEGLIPTGVQNMIISLFEENRYGEDVIMTKDSINQLKELLNLSPDRRAVIQSIVDIAKLILKSGVQYPISATDLASVLVVNSKSSKDAIYNAILEKRMSAEQGKEEMLKWNRAWGFIMANGHLLFEMDEEIRRIESWVSKSVTLLEELENTQN